ncbi:MAG: TetR/AcrR family transcriptional regulator C-terminal domain-containing protein [Actinomycetota bacterium]|nr:TetR/AcrR family transcriptional regulator C-terminal domain-containing protein [Actinomycetota bacterium]
MIEQVIDSLVEVGFPSREALESIFIVGHFILGSALEQQVEAPGMRPLRRMPRWPSGCATSTICPTWSRRRVPNAHRILTRSSGTAWL